MAASNVLQDYAPSAPSEGAVAEQQYMPLYPTLSSDPQTFRMNEISKINKQIFDETQHYRLVLKKYKKTEKLLSYTVAGLGFSTAALSSGAVASTLTGVGAIVGVPLGVVGGVCGAISTALVAVDKKLENKVNKHSRLVALAFAKQETINVFVSKTLNDNSVSDQEFKIITGELQNYFQMKNVLRASFNKKSADSSVPDLAKIKEKLREEIREEFRKKSQPPAPL